MITCIETVTKILGMILLYAIGRDYTCIITDKIRRVTGIPCVITPTDLRIKGFNAYRIARGVMLLTTPDDIIVGYQADENAFRDKTKAALAVIESYIGFRLVEDDVLWPEREPLMRRRTRKVEQTPYDRINKISRLISRTVNAAVDLIPIPAPNGGRRFAIVYNGVVIGALTCSDDGTPIHVELEPGKAPEAVRQAIYELVRRLKEASEKGHADHDRSYELEM